MEAIPQSMDSEWSSLAECPIFAERIQDHGFYNATIDTLVASTDKSNGSTPIELSRKLYQALSPTSPALQFFVDPWVWYSQVSWFNLHRPASSQVDTSYGPMDF